jgi:hypothetical protein
MMLVPRERLRTPPTLPQRTNIAEGAPAVWLSWQDVAMAADRVARRTGGRHWHRQALEPDGAATQLLLAELIGALERRELAHVDPFSNADVFMLSNFADSREALWTLFDRVPQHFARLGGTPNRSRKSGDFVSWWQVVDGPASWARTDIDGWSEYVVRGRRLVATRGPRHGHGVLRRWLYVSTPRAPPP